MIEMMLHDQRARVSRQTLLREVGEAGREKLANSHVAIIGAGGLGSPVIQYLACCGVGTLTIIDDDVVSISNLSRQMLHSTEDVGRNKAESAQAAVARLTPHCKVNAMPFRANEESLKQIISRGVDLLIDASDNLPTRIAANRASLAENVPLLFGSAIRWSGQVGIFDPRQHDTPCFECLFEEDDPNNDVKAASQGVAGTVTGVIGTMMALEAMKFLIGLEHCLVGELLLVDGLHMQFQRVKILRNSMCPHHHD